MHTTEIYSGKIILPDETEVEYQEPLTKATLSKMNINHYRTQSYNWFKKVKASRGDAAHQRLSNSFRNLAYFISDNSNDLVDEELKNKKLLNSIVLYYGTKEKNINVSNKISDMVITGNYNKKFKSLKIFHPKLSSILSFGENTPVTISLEGYDIEEIHLILILGNACDLILDKIKTSALGSAAKIHIIPEKKSPEILKTIPNRGVCIYINSSKLDKLHINFMIDL